MLIIGCDFHSSFQQLAIFDNQTGERFERKLLHPAEAAEFYRGLSGPVRVGMEAGAPEQEQNKNKNKNKSKELQKQEQEQLQKQEQEQLVPIAGYRFLIVKTDRLRADVLFGAEQKSAGARKESA
jgi:hypothetical protein